MGQLYIKINELMQEKQLSKNRICKDLDIPRSNFNKYCRNDMQRLDISLLCKLCEYFDCRIEDLLEYKKD